MRWILSNYDFVCPVLCFLFCLIHFIVQCVHAKKLNKKITALCEKCGMPVVEGETHDCVELDEAQLKLLSEFIASLTKR